MAGRRFRVLLYVALFAVIAMRGRIAGAQDTRQVAEPKIPASCVQLPAQLRAVNDRLAEADENKLDTARIQFALDKCKSGMAVELVPGEGNNAFLSGPLEMRTGVTLLLDEGVTLFGSRDAALYQIKPGAALRGAHAASGICGTIAEGVPSTTSTALQQSVREGCRPLIGVNDAKDVGVMGYGVIDGRGYAKILHKDYSWWEMARKAEPKNDRYFSPRMIAAHHADGLVLYRIALHNSTNVHVSVDGTNGFTAWEVHLLTPTIKGTDARNTDGIDIGSSSNITIAHSWIDSGDDNIAVKTGVTHMSVLANHLYDGHGMSIGSETYTGQSFLLVDGLSEDHTTNGIRIKSNVTRGGPVHDLVYRNICMRGVKNPISISPYYANQASEGFEDPEYTGDRIPDYKAISISNVIDTTPGDVLIAGMNDEHRTEVTLDGVQIAGITRGKVHGRFATVTIGSRGSNIDFGGTDVKVVEATNLPAGTRPQPAFNCDGMFVPME